MFHRAVVKFLENPVTVCRPFVCLVFFFFVALFNREISFKHTVLGFALDSWLLFTGSEPKI